VSPWLPGLHKTAVFDGAEIADTAIGGPYILRAVVSLVLLKRTATIPTAVRRPSTTASERPERR
jgi:hypothetical protein